MLHLLLLIASPTPACEKLSDDYAAVEESWGFWSDFRSKAIKYNQEQALAVGGRWFKDAEDEKLKKREEDADYALKADRIVTLMIANKCTPPDRVAAPKLPVGK